jgi:hypothetical protein
MENVFGSTDQDIPEVKSHLGVRGRDWISGQRWRLAEELEVEMRW